MHPIGNGVVTPSHSRGPFSHSGVRSTVFCQGRSGITSPQCYNTNNDTTRNAAVNGIKSDRSNGEIVNIKFCMLAKFRPGKDIPCKQ